MNKNLTLFITLIWAFSGNTQNILTNGSFENSHHGWGIVRSVDFYDIPPTHLGTMAPQDGTKFCGLRFNSDGTTWVDWQEYIWQDVSMTAGATYKVSVFYSLADMCTRTSDDLGIAFTQAPHTFPNNQSDVTSWLSSITPQVKLENGNFPTDDVNWTELSGYYQATGNEMYTILGCFKTDNTLSTLNIPSDHYFNLAEVYFFIDNFSITECIDYPQIELDDEIILCEGGDVSLDAYYPGATYLWSTGDTTSQITKTINQSGYYSVSVTNNGCTHKDGTQITVFSEGNEFEDVLFCDEDELPIERTVNANQNEEVIWEDGSISATRSISESGIYSYRKSLGSCNYADTFEVLVFNNDVIAYPNPGVDEINFTNSNNVKVTSLFSSDGRVISRNQIQGPNLDLIIEQLSPGYYFLNIEKNGCRSTLTYEKLLIE